MEKTQASVKIACWTFQVAGILDLVPDSSSFEEGTQSSFGLHLQSVNLKALRAVTTTVPLALLRRGLIPASSHLHSQACPPPLRRPLRPR